MLSNQTKYTFDTYVIPWLSKTLIVNVSGSMEHICNKVLGKKLCLQNLRFLEMHNCGHMKKFFSPYTKLEGVKEIIGQEEGAEEVIDKIEFPELTSLSLKSLPSLTSFYPRRVGLGDHGILITMLFDEMISCILGFLFFSSYNNFPFATWFRTFHYFISFGIK